MEYSRSEMWIVQATYTDFFDHKEKLLAIQCFTENQCLNMMIHLDKDIYKHMTYFRVR